MIRRTANSRGYTLVELMMAVSIFGIGVTGVVAMQSASASANGHAKDLAIATNLARSWQEQLSMDATLWGGALNWPINQTRWVQAAGAGTTGWILPGTDTGTPATANFGPAAGPRGEYVDEAANPEDVVFCTHIRLSNLLTPAGSGLIRTEVRVFWPKGSTAWTNNGGNYCNAADVDLVGGSPLLPAAQAQFHFVYQTSTVRETPAF